MSKKIILIRADSSITIGLGHIKRCLVLATRLRNIDKSIKIIFLVRDLLGNINNEIIENGFDVKILNTDELIELIDVINNYNPSLLIVDSYKFDLALEDEIIKKINCKILFFDDMIQKHNCDMVLNHGLHINKNFYKKLLNEKTKLFCGSKYTLLRDEFFRKYKNINTKNKIGIILGGNDVLNLSKKIALLLKKIDKKFKITIITSSVNQNINHLKNINFINLKIDITNVAQILVQQEIIITASGGSIFEVMAMKKKFINIQVSSNQQSIVNYLEKKKIYTTITSNKLNLKILKEKLEYVKKENLYKNLKFNFSKTQLAKDILKEL